MNDIEAIIKRIGVSVKRDSRILDRLNYRDRKFIERILTLAE